MRHRTAAYLAAAWAIAFAAVWTRIKDLIPRGASVFTGASETLRLSGIDAGISTSGRYQAVRPRVRAMDRVTGAGDIRRLLASPSVSARAQAAYGRPSAVNRLLFLNAEPHPGRGTVLLRQAIGF